MKRLVEAIIALVILSGGAVPALACSCGSGSVEISLSPAESRKLFRDWFATFEGALFVGTVQSIEQVEREIDGAKWPQLKVIFIVERFWKGVQGSTATIYTGAGCCDCGIAYKQGERYLVNAGLIEGRLLADICSYQELSAVSRIQRALGKGKQPKH